MRRTLISNLLCYKLAISFGVFTPSKNPTLHHIFYLCWVDISVPMLTNESTTNTSLFCLVSDLVAGGD